MTSPKPPKSNVVLTDEIRQAVAEEACENEGHLWSFNAAVRTGSDRPERLQVGGPDGKFAHIYCPRCGLTHLVDEEPVRGYQAAEQSFKARLKNPNISPRNPAVRQPPPVS